MAQTSTTGNLEKASREMISSLRYTAEFNAPVYGAVTKFTLGKGEDTGALSTWEIYQKYQDINNDYDTLLRKAKEDHGDPFEADPEGVNAQDIKAYYAIHPNLKPGQTYAEGVREFFRVLLSKPDGSERYRYVVRNTNTRKLPMAILRALPRNTRERRAASDRARARHKSGLD